MERKRRQTELGRNEAETLALLWVWKQNPQPNDSDKSTHRRPTTKEEYVFEQMPRGKTDLRLRTVSKALFVDSRIILSLWGKISRSILKPSSETPTGVAVFSQWNTPKEHANSMRVKPRMREVPPAWTQPLDHCSLRHPESWSLYAWPPRSPNFFFTTWYISNLSDYKLLSPQTQTTAAILFKDINCENMKYKVYTSTYIPIIKDKYMLP